MAFVRNPLKDEGEQSSGVIGTDGTPITGDQSAKPVSNWTNLNKYIEGNQGAGSQIAEKMLEQGNQDVNDANNKGAVFSSMGTSEVDKSTKQDKGFETLFRDGDLANVTDQQKTDYSAWKNQANYGGPADATGISGYKDLSDATSKAKSQAAKSYTQDSQYGLATESLGKGNQNYNGGMSMLDVVLARQAGGGQKIDDFNTANTGEAIENKTKGYVGSVNSYISGAADRGKDRGDAATNALQNRLGGITQTLTDRENTTMANQATRYAEDQTRADYASSEELAALDNLINGFGAQVDDTTKNDLLNKSGASKQTYRDYLNREVPAGPIMDGQIPNTTAEKEAESAIEKIINTPVKAAQNVGKKIGKIFG